PRCDQLPLAAQRDRVRPRSPAYAVAQLGSRRLPGVAGGGRGDGRRTRIGGRGVRGVRREATARRADGALVERALPPPRARRTSAAGVGRTDRLCVARGEALAAVRDRLRRDRRCVRDAALRPGFGRRALGTRRDPCAGNRGVTVTGGTARDRAYVTRRGNAPRLRVHVRVVIRSDDAPRVRARSPQTPAGGYPARR